MATRHAHSRHSGAARSHAQPYTTQHRPHQHSKATGATDGQPSDSTTAAPSYNSHTSSAHVKQQQQQRRRRDEEDAGGGGEEADEDDGANPHKPRALELDPRRLEQRQKQIDLGKSTPEYAAYLIRVPLSSREYAQRYDDHPITPNKNYACSKRSFDGQIRKWRRLLHQYDPASASPPATSTATATTSTTASNDGSALSTQMTDNATTSTPLLPNGVPSIKSELFFPTLAAATSTSHSASHHNNNNSHNNNRNHAIDPAARFDMSHYAAATSSSPPATIAKTEPSSSMNIVAPATQPTTASHPPPILFFATPIAPPTSFNDRLASFDEEDLDLLPQTDRAAHQSSTLHSKQDPINDDELVDYEEEDEQEIQMRNEALAAARALN